MARDTQIGSLLTANNNGLTIIIQEGARLTITGILTPCTIALANSHTSLEIIQPLSGVVIRSVNNQINIEQITNETVPLKKIQDLFANNCRDNKDNYYPEDDSEGQASGSVVMLGLDEFANNLYMLEVAS